MPLCCDCLNTCFLDCGRLTYNWLYGEISLVYTNCMSQMELNVVVYCLQFFLI